MEYSVIAGLGDDPDDVEHQLGRAVRGGGQLDRAVERQALGLGRVQRMGHGDLVAQVVRRDVDHDPPAPAEHGQPAQGGAGDRRACRSRAWPG